MSQVEEFCFRAHRMELEEDFYQYGDGAELALAAQLGNALLMENRQLKEEKNTLHQQYSDKIEELEQSRHDLRLKLQVCQAQWESQASELERDVRALNAHVERLTQILTETEREKSRSEQQHNQIIQQLREQLQVAMEVERTVTAQLQSLKQDFSERDKSRPQDEELLSALKEQVARLTQREQALAQRLEEVCGENTELKDSLSSLYARLACQEQQSHTQTQQLMEARQEVEAARGKAQELQSRMEELQEEVSLQRSPDSSLLSEMDRSLDSMNCSQDKEQVTQAVNSILDMLLPVSPGIAASNNLDEGLLGMLGRLKRVAEEITHSQSLQELKAIVGEGSAQCETPGWIQELRDQNEKLLKENAELRRKADSRTDEEVVQRAIKDRDNAIAKKTAMEAELVRSRNDMMYLNNQLLEAIQRKLELSQELEAWQDDIQTIINQQLKVQTEQQMQSKKSNGGHVQFFRKSRKTSVSPSCKPEINHVPRHSPWRDWLKLGK
ncbi:BICD family-like cargo adapter 1 [Trichomycterus rosablanca]|uniref:BICD family-like cargo adapter 1 n=1 Tax=Trichomycterus rosablanca TaxID=2290929 RepID=UPI002F35516B